MLYEASVPVLSRYLQRLAGWLDRAEAHAAGRGLDPDALLQSRLAESMLPLAKQVEIAANFALRACAPLAGRPLPDIAACGPGLAGLREHLLRTRAVLATFEPREFDGADRRRCTSRAGDAEVVLDGAAFLFDYALPNFFFHLSMAYALLRQAGVPIGKADFDGHHAYPPCVPTTSR